MIAAVPRTRSRSANSKQVRSPKVRFNEIEFCAWVAQADAGDRLEYYRGFLVADTLSPLSPLAAPDRTALRRLADGAYRAAAQGLVHLVQHRHGPDDYSYLAIARPRRAGALPDFASLTITEEVAS